MTEEDRVELLMQEKNSCFVFGSNFGGRHGKGAALIAKKRYGAIYGVGIGIQGRSYGIPTKDGDLVPLSLKVISGYIEDFKEFAKANPGLNFIVTRIGCNLAGYTDREIGPLFRYCTSNVYLPQSFIREIMGMLYLIEKETLELSTLYETTNNWQQRYNIASNR